MISIVLICIVQHIKKQFVQHFTEGDKRRRLQLKIALLQSDPVRMLLNPTTSEIPDGAVSQCVSGCGDMQLVILTECWIS